MPLMALIAMLAIILGLTGCSGRGHAEVTSSRAVHEYLELEFHGTFEILKSGKSSVYKVRGVGGEQLVSVRVGFKDEKETPLQGADARDEVRRQLDQFRKAGAVIREYPPPQWVPRGSQLFYMHIKSENLEVWFLAIYGPTLLEVLKASPEGQPLQPFGTAIRSIRLSSRQPGVE